MSDSIKIWPVPPRPDERSKAVEHGCTAIARLSTAVEALHYHDGDEAHLKHLCEVVGAARQSVEALGGIVAGWAISVESVEILDPQRVCRGCGCTDEEACFDETMELPCSWVEADLCSVCAAGVIGGTDAEDDERRPE